MSEAHEYDADRLLSQIGWVRRLAQGLVADPSAAEDLVQETWLAFLRRKPDSSRPLEPWLSTVVHNFARRHRRAEARRAEREADAAREEAQPSSHELVERAGLQRELVEAVLALDEPYRSTLLMRYLEELPPREIARRTGAPIRTVSTRLQRGLAQLRDRLDRRHERDQGAWLAALSEWARVPERRAIPALRIAAIASSIAVIVLLSLVARFVWTSGDDARLPSNVANVANVASAANDELAARRESIESARSSVETRREPIASASSTARAAFGRVLDERAAPVAGATVAWFSAADDRYGRFDPPLALEPHELARSTTDDDGRFALADSRGALEVRVSRAGFADLVERIELGGQGVVVRLEDAARVDGRVLDERAQPIDGVRVRVLRASSRSGAPSGANCDAISDASGSFRFDRLGAGRWRIEAQSDDARLRGALEFELAHADLRVLDLVLSRGATLRGRVVDASRREPIAGARVSTDAHLERAAVCDSDGRFTLAGIAPLEPAKIWIGAEGFATRSRTIGPLSNSPMDCEFELASGEGVVGRVLDSKGEPVALATVIATSDVGSGAAHESDRVIGTTEIDGSFELVGLMRDVPHELVIAAHGFATLTRSFASAKTRLDLGEMRLDPAGRIDGSLVDAHGAPVADAELFVFALGPIGTTFERADPRLFATGRAWSRARSDSRGRFEFDDLASGAWFVATASDVGVERARGSIDVQRGGTSSLALSIDVGAELLGRVVDSNGAGVADVELELRRATTHASERSTASDASGRFRLRGLANVEFELELRPRRDFAPRRIAGVRARDRELACALERAIAIAGRVVDADGRAVELARVRGVDSLGFALGPVWTDVDGRFALSAARGRELTLFAAPSEERGDLSRVVVDSREVAVRGTADESATFELALER